VSRLFLAVDPPADLRAALLDVVPLTPAPGVRWVPPEQWHVTVRFLGEVDEDAALGALATLSAPPCTAEVGPRVSRLGRSVVCLPVRGLDALATAVAGATAAVGAPPEHRFRGHLTLARLRDRAACGVTGTSFGACFGVDRVVAYRSTLGPDGARHDAIGEVRLG
jgi:RNA 2',3'-cyclic 3'-phosphodiesterase